MYVKVICAVILLCAFVHGGPAVGESPKQVDNSIHSNSYGTVEDSLVKKLNAKCIDRDISSCMMLKLMTYVNRFLKKSSIEIGDVEIKKTSVEVETEESGRSMEDLDKMPEEAQMYEVIANKVGSFIRTRSLTWKVTEDTDVVVSTNTKNDGSINLELSLKPVESAQGEARGKKKNQGMGAILALAALKIGLLKGLALKALALLVGKALLVSKLALVLAAVIGLKKLFHQEKHVTYEVVAHPHHEHHEHHDVSGGLEHGHSWGRNFNAADLAYRAHKPTQ